MKLSGVCFLEHALKLRVKFRTRSVVLRSKALYYCIQYAKVPYVLYYF